MSRVSIMVSDVDFLMKLWDIDKNTLDPYITSAKSTETAYWRCSKCGYGWPSSIRSRFRTGPQCPCCESRTVFAPGINDILSVVPLARESYDYEKNKGIDYRQHSVASTKSVWWICPYCGNKYKGSFTGRVDRTDEGYRFRRCTKCKRDDYVPDKPVSKNKRLMKYWDRKKNRLSPDMISIYSERPVYWKCDSCGYEWDSPPRNRYNIKSGCPCCEANSVIVAGINDVAHFLPEIIELFDESLNPNVRLEELGLYSPDPVTFHCGNCGHIWTSPLKNRIRRRRDGKPRLLGCPKCNNNAKKRMCIKTYADEYPELAEVYMEELNGRSLASINSYEANRLLLKWRCKVCGEIFDSRVTAMIGSLKYQTKGCPFCSYTEVRHGESLADKYPEYAALWSKENKMSADKVYYKATHWFKWDCPTCGETFGGYIADVVSADMPCPFCDDRLVLPGVNSFAAKHGDLMAEWDETNNYMLMNPDMISDRTNRRAWWDCPNDPTHIYPMSVAQRVEMKLRGREPCVYCRGYRVKKRHFY